MRVLVAIAAASLALMGTANAHPYDHHRPPPPRHGYHRPPPPRHAYHRPPPHRDRYYDRHHYEHSRYRHDDRHRYYRH
ncbi:extensin-like protein [Novosphingobium sp. PhB165]|nr:extensin-like protein [Novosphingobium sp. PhB165]